MAAPLYDAHNHIADPVLLPHHAEITAALNQIGLKGAVVNGTCPADWQAVIKQAQSEPKSIAAIGLHPWKVNDAPTNWQSEFLKRLNQGGAVIGEIGLDQWIQDHNIQRQQKAFRWQLSLAAQHNLPVSIHCLRAIGPLMETLRSVPLPKRGIHLHAYNGPVELIPELTQLGAFFSFNAGQIKAGSSKVPERIRAVPAERLLIETDAPNMRPPPELRSFELLNSKTENPLTHPATLIDGYKAIATIRSTLLKTLTAQVASNFETYFLN
jgi:TatD DNase family protein